MPLFWIESKHLVAFSIERKAIASRRRVQNGLDPKQRDLLPDAAPTMYVPRRREPLSSDVPTISVRRRRDPLHTAVPILVTSNQLLPSRHLDRALQSFFPS